MLSILGYTLGYKQKRCAEKLLYSVGGHIQFGETAEEAVAREVFEETGVKLEIDHLGFIHENFFYGGYAKKALR